MVRPRNPFKNKEYPLEQERHRPLNLLETIAVLANALGIEVVIDGQQECLLAAKSAAVVTGDSDLREFLDWLEDILLRMIAGIFRFLLVHLPREFCRVVASVFPTMVQVLAFGGLDWMMRHEWLVARLDGEPLPEPGWCIPSLGRC